MFLSGELSTGAIRFEHALRSATRIGTIHFWSLMEADFGSFYGDLGGDKSTMTGFSCHADFLDHQGLKSKVVVCARQRTPAIRHIEHSIQYLDLIGACAQFVAAVSRTLPDLRGHEFSDDEKDAVLRNVERVRSTADWIAHAIQTGDVSLDEALAELLKR